MSTTDLNLGRESLLAALAKFTNAGIGFVGVIIFARVLGSRGVGEYYFLLTISQVLVQVSGGMGGAVRKRVSEIDTSADRYLGLVLIAHVTYVVIVAPTVLLAEPFLPFSNTSTVSPATILLTIAFLVGAVGLFMISNRLYAGLGHPGRATWLDAIRSVLTLAFQLLFLWYGWGSFGLLLGLGVASFACAVGTLILARTIPRMPDMDTLRSTFDYARWSVPSSVVALLYDRLDVLFIGAFLGSVAVGRYETAVRIALPASLFASSIAGPLHVKASGRTSKGKKVGEDVTNAMTYSGFIAIPMLFGAIALDDKLMGTVYGPEFADAGPVLIGILCFQVIRSFQSPLTSAITGSDKPNIVFKIQAIGIILNIPLAFSLVGTFDVFGVIAATVAVECVMLASYQYISVQFGGPFFPQPVVAQIISGVLMWGVLSWVRQFTVISGWPILLVLVGTGAVVYLTSTYLLSKHVQTTVHAVIISPIKSQLISD